MELRRLAFAWIIATSYACSSLQPEVEEEGDGGSTALGSTGIPVSSSSSSSSTSGEVSSETTGGSSSTSSLDSTSSSPGSTSSSESSSGAAAVCDNLIQDGDESDVDCGGATCARCDEGAACTEDTDCASILCNAADGSCVGPTTLLWLDGDDAPGMFTDDTCMTPVAADDDPVRCWRSRGSIEVDFVSQDGQGRYEMDGGVELDGDLLVANGVFGGLLDEVAVFLVATEISGTNSFDINLNHPEYSGDGRYSCHLPFNASRRLVWDPGNSSSVRVETEPDLVSVGETHIYELVNSESLDVRRIRVDGVAVDEGAGNSAAAASNVSLGSDADLHVYDFRVTQSAPDTGARQVIEGDLACRWNLRSQLEPGHPYHSADDFDDTGCP